MTADSGTQQQQQQQHEYAYDTCCLLSRRIDVSDASVLRLQLLLQYHYCLLLVTKLVASHDMCKTESGCRFRLGITSEDGPHFSGGGRPRNDTQE